MVIGAAQRVPFLPVAATWVPPSGLCAPQAKARVVQIILEIAWKAVIGALVQGSFGKQATGRPRQKRR